MSRKTLKINGYTSEQIKALIKSENKYTIGIRLYAIYQVSLGQSLRKLETLYHTSFKQIGNWVHRFEKEGIEGLKDKQRSGRNARLQEGQREEIKSVLINNRPQEFGYNTATWNGPILIDFIKSKYGIEYKKTQVYNILKSLGFTFQKGRVTYPESDERNRQEFKEAVKKTLDRA